jgi:outer membrane receptor protein involved in Fe transport
MIQRKNGRSAAGLLCAASATALSLGFAGAAFAQDAAAVGEVVVTASRIQAAGFTAPTPTTVLGSADLQRRAPTSVLEVINDIPAFRPSTTSQNTSSPTNGANSNAGANLVDLRGLSNQRTLLLLNGRRTGGSQDLNQFPVILTQRIDVVTGGASAAYGSDAVAGVVNIVLDTKFEGLKGNAQYGQSKYGDDETWTGSLAYGGRLFNDRAHLLLGGDYSYGKGAYTAEHPYDDKRPWVAAERYLQIQNPCGILLPTLPASCGGQNNGLSPFGYYEHVRFSTQTPGGIITAGPLKGITFEDNGTYRQFQYGIVTGNNMIGGDKAGSYNQIFALRPKFERYSLLGHFDYKVTDKVNAWLEYGNAQTKGTVPIVRPRDQGTITILRGNPFIPAAIAAQMAPGALNLATLTMGRLNSDGGQPDSDVKNMIYRFAGGLDGAFGALGKEWTWDAHYQYGRLHQEMLTYGSRNTARWTQALDAVNGPNGVPVCRNPAGGCVPFNIFGPNAASQAARDFVFGTQSANRDTTQNNATFNLHGEPVSTWAGPVALALGGEYRKEQVNTTSDPIARVGGWDSGNIRPLAGSYNVKEVYAEAAVPLAKDMVLARSLDLNGAIRYADYSTAGGATTWKVGGTWKPIDEIMFRSTLSRDIRAPNNTELFNTGGVSRNNITQIDGPSKGSATLTDYVTSGNPNLKPEKSKTWTAGVTLQPKFARLRFSADYYNIKITDQIGTIGAQDVVNLCAAGRPDMCALLTFDGIGGGRGTITAVQNSSVNNARFQTRGLDLEASFVQPLDQLPGGFVSLPGQITLRAFGTKVFEYAQTDLGGYLDRVGQNHATFAGTLNIPEWLATYNVQYDVGKFMIAAQFKYIGPGVTEITSITGTATQRDNNKLPSQTTVNLSASYVILDADGRRLQAYGTIQNLFNRGPPFPVYPISQPAYMYDSLGMAWRMGLRFQY